MNKKTWMYTAIVAIVLSLLSLLLPIISYTSSKGVSKSYNIFGLLSGKNFVNHVLVDYDPSYQNRIKGTFLESIFKMGNDNPITFVIIALLVVIAVASVILSFVGIRSITKQYESQWPYVLTIGGLIGTALPAIVLLVLHSVTKDYFNQPIRMGAYIYITPIAMIIAVLAVFSRHRLAKEVIYAKKASAQFMRRGGDLPPI